MEALYSPHQDGFALPQWNNASCEKPLILPAYRLREEGQNDGLILGKREEALRIAQEMPFGC